MPEIQNPKLETITSPSAAARGRGEESFKASKAKQFQVHTRMRGRSEKGKSESNNISSTTILQEYTEVQWKKVSSEIICEDLKKREDEF